MKGFERNDGQSIYHDNEIDHRKARHGQKKIYNNTIVCRSSYGISIDCLKEIPPSHTIYVIVVFSPLSNEQCLDNTIRTTTAEASLENKIRKNIGKAHERHTLESEFERV